MSDKPVSETSLSSSSSSTSSGESPGPEAVRSGTAANGAAPADESAPTSPTAADGASALDLAKLNGTEPKPEPAPSLFIEVFGRTDVGQVREHNEDNFIIADLTRGSRGVDTERVRPVGERGTLLGVCDGMGGAAAGEVASQLAVDIIHQKMSAGSAPTSRIEIAQRLVEAIESAGARIYTEAKLDRSRRGMGTTATVGALVDDHLFFGQVGDSRAYILRGDKLVQATRDQSLVNQLIEAGQLTEEEAETFEHNNIILQALGTSDSVQVDLTYVELRRGDMLLVCSDGLSGMVRNDEIREILIMAQDPVEACTTLIDRANQAGGHDNVTVVIARFDGDALKPATRADMDGLKYQKFILPDASSPRSSSSSSESSKPRDSVKSQRNASTRPPSGAPDAHDDDDASAHDGLGLEHENVHPDDSIDIPTEGAPTWLVAMMILSGVACVIVAAYYYLR